MAEEEELFDLVIPPGVPRSVIRTIIQKYDVELVERSQPLYYANMSGDVRDLLAFRGRKEVVHIPKYQAGSIGQDVWIIRIRLICEKEHLPSS